MKLLFLLLLPVSLLTQKPKLIQSIPSQCQGTENIETVASRIISKEISGDTLFSPFTLRK